MIGTLKQIRQSVVDALLNQTAAGARVANADGLPLDVEKYRIGPRLTVWTPHYKDAPMVGRRKHLRTLDIAIQGAIAGDNDQAITDAMDDLSDAVRDVLISETWVNQWRAFAAAEGESGIDPAHPNLGSFTVVIQVQYEITYTPAAPAATGQIHEVTTDPLPATVPTTEQTIVEKEPPAPAGS